MKTRKKETFGHFFSDSLLVKRSESHAFHLAGIPFPDLHSKPSRRSQKTAPASRGASAKKSAQVIPRGTFPGKPRRPTTSELNHSREEKRSPMNKILIALAFAGFAAAAAPDIASAKGPKGPGPSIKIGI